MWHSTACQALSSGKCLLISYSGYTRVVEVHACGETAHGHAVMRVWQVEGGSQHNEPIGWKMLRLDETTGLSLLDRPSSAPRPGYRPNDSAMQRIYCQI